MVDIWDTSGSGFFSPPFVPIQAVVIYATFGLTTSCEQRGIFIVKSLPSDCVEKPIRTLKRLIFEMRYRNI